MPRPRLEPGETGTVRITPAAGGGFTAYARFRRNDGELKTAEVVASSRTKAEAALRARIRARLGEASGADLHSGSTVELLARYHLAKEREHLPARAPATLRELRSIIEVYVIPKLGSLTLAQATPPRLDAQLSAVLRHSYSQASKMHWALTAMFRRAVVMGALTTSPMEHIRMPAREKGETIALSLEELAEVRAIAKAWHPKNRKRLRTPPSEILEFLVGTGCRPAEALGLAWEDVHLDDPVPWVRIAWQIVRDDQDGKLLRRPTKTKDTTDLALPSFAAEILRSRRERDPDGWLVFPSEVGTFKSPGSMRDTWRRAFKGSDWAWVTQRVLRRTVATLVAKEEGSELAAKQLRHTSDKTTKRHYIVPVNEVLEVRSMEKLGGA